MSGYPPNTQDSNGVYIGDNYAIDSSGGFSIQQGLPEIKLQNTSIANQFDVTENIIIECIFKILRLQKIKIMKKHYLQNLT